jgi:hypothetical protein
MENCCCVYGARLPGSVPGQNNTLQIAYGENALRLSPPCHFLVTLLSRAAAAGVFPVRIRLEFGSETGRIG